MNGTTLTRRNLLAGLAAVALTGTADSALPDAAPLVAEDELLCLALDPGYLIAAREPVEWEVSAPLGFLHASPLTMTARGDAGWTRTGLAAELRRLAALVENRDAALVDTDPDPVSVIVIDVEPGTARVTGQEFCA